MSNHLKSSLVRSQFKLKLHYTQNDTDVMVGSWIVLSNSKHEEMRGKGKVPTTSNTAAVAKHIDAPTFPFWVSSQVIWLVITMNSDECE